MAMVIGLLVEIYRLIQILLCSTDTLKSYSNDYANQAL